MKAIRFHEFGGSDVLRLEEVDDPKPGPGEVTVRVRASALNHLDVDVRAGISRFPVTFPHILGIEIAGDIEEIGEGVTGWEPGDRVNPYLMTTCGTCRYCTTGRPHLCLTPGFIGFATGGGYAEKVVVTAKQLIRIPDAVSYEQAAALQVAFGTSWHMLFTRAGLRAGERVLVNSVGSGIGSAAVQLAHHAGAFVIGNASGDDKLEEAQKLGMDVGINYKRDDVVERVMEITGGEGVDVAYEHVGGEELPVRVRLALEGRPAGHVRRARGRGRPLRHHPVLPHREAPDRLVHVHPRRGREVLRPLRARPHLAARPLDVPARPGGRRDGPDGEPRGLRQDPVDPLMTRREETSQ